MKSILILGVTCLLFLSSSAQQIQNITFIPANPTDNDTIYMIVEAMFTSGGCELQSMVVNTDPAIVVDLFHCVGMAAVICYVTDTIELGVLPPGMYIPTANLYYGAGVPCTTFQLADSDPAVLNVGSSVGIRSDFPVRPSVTVLGGIINIEKAALNSTFQLFDISGKQLFSEAISAASQRFTIDQKSGIYFYKIQDKDGHAATGKLIIPGN
jgi:hypothetical protein